METGDKGRLIGCPVAGWNCHDQKRLDVLGLDFIADELGTETASLAEAQGMYDRGEPFLMYLWEPHWFFGVNELVGVKLAPNAPCETFTEANNWEVCGPDKWPGTGWAVDYPMNYGNPETFAKPENQKALEFFGKMALSNADQAAMLVAVREGAELNDVVAEWKANNKSTWEAWLP
jgi:glycine betaine/proline transport system substrate-binding protein